MRISLILIVLLLLNSTNLIAQEVITIRVVGHDTQRPIEGVSILYPNQLLGTFTNADGVAFIHNKAGERLQLTHITYDTLQVGIDKIKKNDTLNLEMKIRALVVPEVSVSYFDLKKALNYVLSNFNDYYVNTATEKIGNFKEVVYVNGEIRRLILSKLSWWSESYSLSSKKTPIFKLIDLEFNKNLSLDIFTDLPEINSNPSKTGYMDLKSVIPMLYLESYLNTFLKYNPNLQAHVESSNDNILVVAFQTDWTTVNAQTTRSVGNFTFDKSSGAIIEFNNKVEFKDIKIHQIPSHQKTFSQEKISMTSRLSFEKKLDGKLSLNKFELTSLNTISYNNKVFRNDFVNTYYKLQEYPSKQQHKKGAVDLSIPLYRNTAQKHVYEKSLSVNLSKKELEFIAD